jgi:hypothetical protein
MSLTNEEIKNRLGYHRATFPVGYDPDGERPLATFLGDLDSAGRVATAPVHAHLRRLYVALSMEVLDAIEPSREQSLALTALQESLMWANAAVAMQAPLVSE